MAALGVSARPVNGLIQVSVPSWLLAAYVVILLISHATAVRNLIFFSLLGLTLWKLWRRELPPIMPLRRPWAVYGLIAAVSVVVAVNPDYFLKEFWEEIITSIAAICFGALWVRDRPTLRRFLGVLALANLVIVTLAVIKAVTLLAADRLDLLRKGAARWAWA